MNKWLCLFLSLLTFSGIACGADTAPIVWVDKAASFEGRVIREVMPVTNGTEQDIPLERLAEIQKQMEEVLDKAGVMAREGSEAVPAATLKIQSTLTSFKTGSAAGRWVGFGAGAAKCSIRAKILDADTDQLLAEVMQTRVVDTGGFLTIGADGRIHRDVAREIAETIVKSVLKAGSKQ